MAHLIAITYNPKLPSFFHQIHIHSPEDEMKIGVVINHTHTHWKPRGHKFAAKNRFLPLGEVSAAWVKTGLMTVCQSDESLLVLTNFLFEIASLSENPFHHALPQTTHPKETPDCVPCLKAEKYKLDLERFVTSRYFKALLTLGKHNHP